MNEISVVKVIVSEIPKGCGDCPMMVYEHDATPRCMALPREVNEISGNSYDMQYRRSDCVLQKEGD